MTYLPISQLSGNNQFYRSGDVTIDPGAAIAPGVLLQAEPGSELIIASGVCVGAGAVLHARNGSLILEVGVSLGSGVLIVGSGHVGAHTSIGTAATLLNPLIAPGEVIPSCALVGDTSRRIPELEAPTVTQSSIPKEQFTAVIEDDEESTEESEASPDSATEVVQPENPPPASHGSVAYGRVQITQLMETLFPHRQSSNNP